MPLKLLRATSSCNAHALAVIVFLPLATFMLALFVDPFRATRSLLRVRYHHQEHDQQQFHLPFFPFTSSSSSRLCVPLPADDDPVLRLLSSSAPAALHDYAAFHARARRCLLLSSSSSSSSIETSDSSSSSSCDTFSPPRLLLFTNKGSRGGLGYRLAKIRRALLLAIATHRVFFLSWPENSSAHSSFDLTTALHPSSIDWRPPWGIVHAITARNPPGTANVSLDGMHAVVQMGKPLVYDENGRVRDRKKKRRIRRTGKKIVSADVKETDFQKMFDRFEIVYLHVKFTQKTEPRLLANSLLSDVLLTARGKNESSALSDTVSEIDDAFVMTLNRHLTQALFRPSPAVAALVDQRLFAPSSSNTSLTTTTTTTTTDNTSLSLSQEFVAVHVRTGGDINESTQMRMHFVMSNMSSHAHRLLDCASEIDPSIGSRRIFLASDSLTFKSVFTSIARSRGAQVLTQTERASVHIKRYAHEHEEEKKNKGRDEMCLRFLDVFADVFALGRGRALVGRPSSYVVVARELGSATKMIQLFLGVGRKEGECNVRRLAMEERYGKERRHDLREGEAPLPLNASEEGSVPHFSRLWYDGPEGTVGIIGDAERGPVPDT